VIGILFGIIPLTGFVGLASFGLASSAYVYLYCTLFANIDDEEAHGGIFEIIKEGFMTNAASFIVTWIIVYSYVHWDSELAERK
jgi:hypothetical protein